MSQSSWYRRYVWNYKGNREYTKSGYDAAKLRFNDSDLEVDCTGRHYVITGSNSGIGLEMARAVARRGGVVHMVCRNRDSATRARSDIITSTGNDKIHVHTVDLSQPRDVARWACGFAATQDKVHVLINNAGCMLHKRIIDEDNIEANFAVNTLAVHIMVTSLLPLLQRAEDGRVVTVSSAGMLTVKLDPYDLMHNSLEPWNGVLVYGQNKRQQVVMMLWYAQRYDKVHFSSMHPGWADTPAVRTSIPQFYEAMKGNLRTPGEGADTAVWLAISKAALKHPSGLFFQDREPVSIHLPLAWTRSSVEDEDLFMAKVEEIYQKIISPVPHEDHLIKAPLLEPLMDASQQEETSAQKAPLLQAPVASISEVTLQSQSVQSAIVEDKQQENITGEIPESLKAPVASVPEVALPSQQDTNKVESFQAETIPEVQKAPVASISEVTLQSKAESTKVSPSEDQSIASPEVVNDLPKAPVASMSEFSLLSPPSSTTSPTEQTNAEVSSDEKLVNISESTQMASDSATEEPVSSSTVEDPVTTSATEAPIISTAADEPISISSVQQPIISSNSDEPESTIAAEQVTTSPDLPKAPVASMSEFSLASPQNSSSPVDQPKAVEEPVNRQANEEPQDSSPVEELINFGDETAEISSTEQPKPLVAAMSDLSLGSLPNSANPVVEPVDSSANEESLSSLIDVAPISMSTEGSLETSSPEPQSLPVSSLTDQSESLESTEKSPSPEVTSTSPSPVSLSFSTDDLLSSPVQTVPLADVHHVVAAAGEQEKTP